MSAPHRRAVAILGCVAALATVPSVATAAGNGDKPAQEDGPITLIDAGDPALQLLLPGRPAAGQTARLQYAEILDQTFDDGLSDTSFHVAVDYGETATVMSVDADGSYVVRHHVDSVDVAGDMPNLDELHGYTYEHRISVNGTFVSGIELDAGRGSEDALGLFAHRPMQPFIGYPAQPVGVGAQWSHEVEVPDSAFPLTVTVLFDVIELDADQFVLDVTWSEDVDERIMGSHVTGTISGSARITGSLHNALDVSNELNQRADFVYEGGSMNGDEIVEQSVVVESTSYERAA